MEKAVTQEEVPVVEDRMGDAAEMEESVVDLMEAAAEGMATVVVDGVDTAEEGVQGEVMVEATEVATVDCCTAAIRRSRPPSGSYDPNRCSSSHQNASPPQMSPRT